MSWCDRMPKMGITRSAELTPQDMDRNRSCERKVEWKQKESNSVGGCKLLVDGAEVRGGRVRIDGNEGKGPQDSWDKEKRGVRVVLSSRCVTIGRWKGITTEINEEYIVESEAAMVKNSYLG